MESFLLHQHFDTLGNWITSSTVYKMTQNPVLHHSFLLLWQVDQTTIPVQLALICFFLKLNLDMLIAMRTAPGNSFVNPVERIMSILNLGFQGVTLERKSVDKYETKIKVYHSISDIRTVSEKDPSLKDAFIESVQQPLVKVCDRFNRLQLKEKKIQGLTTTATAEQLEELFLYAKQVDSTLAQTDSTKVELSKKTNLKSFMSKHCQIRHYSFRNAWTKHAHTA